MSDLCQCERLPGEIIVSRNDGWAATYECSRCGKRISSTGVPSNPLAKICSKDSRIYLASPYTHTDPVVMQTRYELALYAASVLANCGYIVYSPITYTHVMATRYNIQPTNSDWWIDFDESFIKNWATVIAVLMIPGYKTSSGISREIGMARDAGLLEIHLTMEKLYDIARAGSTRLA